MYVEAICVTTDRNTTPYPVHTAVMLEYKSSPIPAWLHAHITYYIYRERHTVHMHSICACSMHITIMPYLYYGTHPPNGWTNGNISCDVKTGIFSW